MKAGVLDANVLLRFFLQDDPKQSPATTAFLQRAEERHWELFLHDATVAEVTFVMEKVYRRARGDIAAALLDFMQNPFIGAHEPAVLSDALARYGAPPIDLPDALVAAKAAARKIPAVSFDRALDGFTEVTRFEPKGGALGGASGLSEQGLRFCRMCEARRVSLSKYPIGHGTPVAENGGVHWAITPSSP